jgi:hypothetical protein
MTKHVLVACLILVCSVPLVAQRGGLDRLAAKPVFRPHVPVQTIIGTTETTENPDTINLQVQDTYDDGENTPKGTIGFRHDVADHPWFLAGSYSYDSASSHKDKVGAAANYQLWTGKGKSSPYVQIEADYASHVGVAQEVTAYFDAGTSFGSLSLDAIAGIIADKPKGGSKTSDFYPSLSASYSFSTGQLLVLDYSFDNKVDGESDYDAGLRQSIGHGFSIELLAEKHSVFALRLRKELTR